MSWQKTLGIDPLVWYRVVGKQPVTLQRLALAAALCPEVINDRKVWRLPKSFREAVSMAEQCWPGQAEERIREAIRVALSAQSFEKQMEAAIAFDMRFAAWIVACYSKIAVDMAYEYPKQIESGYDYQLKTSDGQYSEADLTRASDHATREMMFWITNGSVDEDYYNKLRPLLTVVRFMPGFTNVFVVTRAAAYAVRSLIVIDAIAQKKKDTKNWVLETIQDGRVPGVRTEQKTAGIGKGEFADLDLRWLSRELSSEWTIRTLTFRDDDPAKISWSHIAARAAALAARTFPLDGSSSSGELISSRGLASFAAGALAGAAAARVISGLR